jgi:hypothetical protein
VCEVDGSVREVAGMADTRDVSSVVLGRREMVVPTDADEFRYLRANWSSVYTIIRPSQDDDTWKAIARFGRHDELVAATADELLGLIRRHYGPETEGYPFTMRPDR